MRVFFYVSEGSKQEQTLLEGLSVQSWLVPAFHFTTPEELTQNLRETHKDRNFAESDSRFYRQLIVEGNIIGRPNTNGAFRVTSTKVVGYYCPEKDQMEPLTPQCISE